MLQAGPGIPAWHYNSYSYYWSGPVDAADTVRFIYVGPLVLFFWRMLGVVALAVLFVWLARLSYGGTWRLPGMPRKARRSRGAAGIAGLRAVARHWPRRAGARSDAVRAGDPGTELLARAQDSG